MRAWWLWLLLGAVGLWACEPPEEELPDYSRPPSTRRDAGTVLTDAGTPDAGTGQADSGVPGCVLERESGTASIPGLDEGFGSRGHVVTNFLCEEDQATAVAVQSDGKAVVAGFGSRPLQYGWSLPQMALARYHASGALDENFGDKGRVRLTLAGDDESYAQAVLQLPSGKLLVAGYLIRSGLADLVVARFDSSGEPDTTFGTGGVVTFGAASEDDRAYALAVQADGKVLVAGRARVVPGTYEQWGVLRLLQDGTLDSTFGSGGVAIGSGPHGGFQARALVAQPDGSILVAGGPDVVRLHSDGTVDTAFSFSFPQGARAISFRSLVRLSDGKLLLGGSSSSDNRSTFSLARLLADGTWDTTFGTGGRVDTVPPGLGTGSYGGMALLPDGRVMVAGEMAYPETEVALLRYSADGVLDETFGTSGLLSGSFGFVGQGAQAVAVQPGLGVLVVGSITDGNAKSSDWLVARFKP